jgi:hypothetical protein
MEKINNFKIKKIIFWKKNSFFENNPSRYFCEYTCVDKPENMLHSKWPSSSPKAQNPKNPETSFAD